MDTWSLVILALLVIILPTFRKVYFRDREEKEVPKKKERQVFFDVIKGVAIIAVVLIHVTYLFNLTVGATNNEFFLTFFNNISRFAIAFFFICSGILLTPIKGKSGWKDFYQRKFIRILVPYFLVSLVIFAFNTTSITDFLYNFVSGKLSVPFYFVTVLIQLYLLFPLLSRFRKSKYFLVGTFILTFGYQLSPLTSFPFGVPLFLKFLFFFAYGIYFREHYLNYVASKKEFHVWLLISLAYLLTILLMPERYYNHRYFYGIALFNILFYFKDRILQWKGTTNFFAAFGRNSLWIFLIHFELMWLFFPWVLSKGWNYYVTFFLFFIDALIISYFGALLCRWGYGHLTKLFKKIKI